MSLSRKYSGYRLWSVGSLAPHGGLDVASPSVARPASRRGRGESFSLLTSVHGTRAFRWTRVTALSSHPAGHLAGGTRRES